MRRRAPTSDTLRGPPTFPAIPSSCAIPLRKEPAPQRTSRGCRQRAMHESVPNRSTSTYGNNGVTIRQPFGGRENSRRSCAKRVVRSSQNEGRSSWGRPAFWSSPSRKRCRSPRCVGRGLRRSDVGSRRQTTFRSVPTPIDRRLCQNWGGPPPVRVTQEAPANRWKPSARTPRASFQIAARTHRKMVLAAASKADTPLDAREPRERYPRAEIR